MKPRIGPAPEPHEKSPWDWIRTRLPFGLGVSTKPKHFREMFQILRENFGKWGYAYRILDRGVCDGCSLGPRGLQDDVIDGIHLCMTRLKLLKLNTMEALDVRRLIDVTPLETMSGEELRLLGRLPYPMVRHDGERGFRRLAWSEAIEIAARGFKATRGDRTAWFATSRGLTNEAYYTFQKVGRLLGSPHVDYCARLCHAPSVYGLKDAFGIGAPSCSLSDFIGTDLLVLWGANVSNNQPVTTKYIHEAKKRGTRVVLVNPFREPGLERYWVPSIASSAVFGTRILDDHYPVKIGGDIAFMNAILKQLVEDGGLDEEYLAKHGQGVEEAKAKLGAMSWERLERDSGLTREDARRFASIYREAKTAVFVYSMGLTQHRFGVENVRSIATLALARGMLGREKCGVMPIRGHSGVQGGSECGVGPGIFPGGEAVSAESARKWTEIWGHPVPSVPGLPTPLQIEAAHRGEIDVLYSIGGNLYETLPDPVFVKEAMARIPLRIHQDIVMNSSMLIPGGTVLLLPAATRYETPGGQTATSTERRIRYTPEIPGPRIGEAKPEWEIPVLVGRAALSDGAKLLPYETPAQVREEIDRVIPLYKGIANLKKAGDSVQWGGPRLFENGDFRHMPGGRAKLLVQDLPDITAPPGCFTVTTRRGKQFNSILYGQVDASIGIDRRDAILLSEEDARSHSIEEGTRLRLTSDTGTFEGTATITRIRPGNIQVYWPEGNVLIPRRVDPISGEPDYNAWVRIEKIG